MQHLVQLCRVWPTDHLPRVFAAHIISPGVISVPEDILLMEALIFWFVNLQIHFVARCRLCNWCTHLVCICTFIYCYVFFFQNECNVFCHQQYVSNHRSTIAQGLQRHFARNLRTLVVFYTELTSMLSSWSLIELRGEHLGHALKLFQELLYNKCSARTYCTQLGK